MPLRLRHGKLELAFIATQTAFGTATDVTVSELSIESFFPADRPTAEALRAIAENGVKRKTQPQTQKGPDEADAAAHH